MKRRNPLFLKSTTAETSARLANQECFTIRNSPFNHTLVKVAAKRIHLRLVNFSPSMIIGIALKTLMRRKLSKIREA